MNAFFAPGRRGLAVVMLAGLVAGIGPAGQAQSADLPDDFVVQVWDTDSGLPHSTVTSLAQTADGYLWVGTRHGGLARFNGMRFVNFDPGNTPGLKSIEIQKLAVDAQDTLWVGNVEGGLSAYQNGKFHFEYWTNDTPRAWLENIMSSQPGCISFFTARGMIFRRTEAGGTNRWETFVVPNVSVNAMLCQDGDGVVWYRTDSGQLAQVRGTNVTVLDHPPGLPPAAVRVLTKDAMNSLWIGTTAGLAEWSGNRFIDRTPPQSGDDVSVQAMLPCPGGGFWVMTPHHLRRFLQGEWGGAVDLTPAQGGTNDLADASLQFTDSRGGAWLWHERRKLAYVSRDGKISWLGDAGGRLVGSVACWYEDREGNVWMGMNDGGLVRLRPRLFHLVWPAAGLDKRAARSVCEDEQGVLWFGTAGAQIWRWADGGFSDFSPRQSQFVEDTKVCPTGDGDLWVGTVKNGLLRLHNGEFEHPFEPRKIGTVARCLLRDHRGNLWIGSEFGLFRWTAAGGLKTFTPADGFSPAYVLSLAEDQRGDLWCGTALGELRWYHGGSFTRFRPLDSLTDEATLRAAAAADPIGERNRGALSGGERFWALHFDEDGALWIGSLGGGLLRFKEGKFTRFSTAEDLPSEHVSQILEDNRNQLWLGTRAGIVRVSRGELNAFADRHGPRPNFVSYGKSDGLPALECSGGSQPACWRGRDGRLWFTTVRGAVWVDPDSLRVNRLPPPVSIEEVRVDGRNFPVEDSAPGPARPIRVAAGRHYFEFQFCALSFTAPDNVKFQWRLAGLDKAWVNGGDRRMAAYSYLPPGSYEFQVKACNNDGVWNEAPAVLGFTVLPYFWQQWWFKTGMVLLVVALGVTIYAVRVSRLRALERLRLRIARDLHDEVGANLGSISLLAQMMEQTPSASDAAQVRGIAAQTIDTLRDIIWFIDPTHDKLSDLGQRLEETVRLMLPTVSHNFRQVGEFGGDDLSLAFRRNVPLLFKETLHNALKHSHATRVDIEVRRVDGEFQFCVADNGAGFNPAKKYPGNGLRNLRRRAAEIGGRVEIESAPGKGTVVTLVAPITQTRDWFQTKP